MKRNAVVSRYLALAFLMSSSLVAAEKLHVAVYDFITPSITARSYQETRVDNPLATKPEPLLTPEQIEKLPEEDRLAAYRREQEAMERWQKQKNGIELERYEEFIEANKKVRAQLMESAFGRTVVNGTGIMEAELSRYPDVFRVIGKRGGSDAQRDIKMEGISSASVDGPGAGDLPTHFVEGKVADLVKREVSMADGPTSIKTRTYILPVTISLYEAASREIKSVYSSDERLVDRGYGNNFREEGEVIQHLLRQAAVNAAVKMHKDLAPLEQPASGQGDPVAILESLKKMLEMGLIDQEEYDRKKQEVLRRM